MTEEEIEAPRHQAFEERWRLEEQPPAPKCYNEADHHPFYPEPGPTGPVEELRA